MAKKQLIKNILLAMLWTSIGAGTIVLLVAAIQQKDARHCMAVDIHIKGVNNHFFVDKKDILNTIVSLCNGDPIGKQVGSFNLNAVEEELQKNVWIKTAQLYFDNNERLQVNVLEREPVARVFSTGGNTFYIDSSLARLPLSEKFSARLPIFTNFPSDKKTLQKADSNLLREIHIISNALQADSFSMAMIDQVDITPERSFEMIPKFGNTTIVFGDASDAGEKLSKLRLFYREVVVNAGWSKYSEINIRYSNQVVCKRKGVAEVKADSLRTLQLMKVIAENAERMASDTLQSILPDNETNTTNHNIIQQSLERDADKTTNTNEEPKPQGPDSSETAAPPLPEKAAKTGVQSLGPAKQTLAGNKPALVKPAEENAASTGKPNEKTTKKPKLLMPAPVPKGQGPPAPANEY